MIYAFILKHKTYHCCSSYCVKLWSFTDTTTKQDYKEFFTNLAPSSSLERWLRIGLVNHLWWDRGMVAPPQQQGEVSTSGCVQGRPRVNVLIIWWPRGKCQEEWWDFHCPLDSSHTALGKPRLSLFHCDEWRCGNGWAPAPEPNSWWVASRCAAGVWWPLSLCVLLPTEYQSHQLCLLSTLPWEEHYAKERTREHTGGRMTHT